MGKDDMNGAHNRAPVFKGENYTYWKDNIYVHLTSVDKMFWVTIEDNPFFSQKVLLKVLKL